ncbi:hypothetical protein VNO80_30595 [Phaseolus coccineus]|uniref:Uncharacterized protein n=1 Tax=Phaseolus coccineus TaxID=3886 RepID=A0AAN9QG91_PHACN
MWSMGTRMNFKMKGYMSKRNIGINWEYEVITSLFSSGPHSSFDPQRNRTQLCQKHNNPKSSLTFFALFAIPPFNPHTIHHPVSFP